MNSEKYIECENKGRTLFQKILERSNAKEYEFSSDQYSSWDCKFWTDNTEFIVEIKVRFCSHLDYSDWMLEVNKYDRLQSIKGNAKLLYVNFFNDDYCAIWLLDKINLSSAREMNCKATTVEDNGYKNKNVTFLKLADAWKKGKLNFSEDEEPNA